MTPCHTGKTKYICGVGSLLTVRFTRPAGDSLLIFGNLDMEIESQRFVALEGTRTWASGTIKFAAECDRFHVDLSESPRDFRSLRPRFEVSRHCFLIAAFKLLEHAEWAVEMGAFDVALTIELNAHAMNIKRLRDLNEHKLEYFKGGGRRRALWDHKAVDGIADASSTVETRIGNLLDWREIGGVAARLSEALPK